MCSSSFGATWQLASRALQLRLRNRLKLVCSLTKFCCAAMGHGDRRLCLRLRDRDSRKSSSKTHFSIGHLNRHRNGTLQDREFSALARIELEPWLPAIDRSRQSAALVSGIPNEAAQLTAVIAVIVSRFGYDLKPIWMDANSFLIGLSLPYPECTQKGRAQLSSGLQLCDNYV